MLLYNCFLRIHRITEQRLDDSDVASSDEGDENDSLENVEKTGDILNTHLFSTLNLILSILLLTF